MSEKVADFKVFAPDSANRLIEDLKRRGSTSLVDFIHINKDRIRKILED